MPVTRFQFEMSGLYEMMRSKLNEHYQIGDVVIEDLKFQMRLLGFKKWRSDVVDIVPGEVKVYKEDRIDSRDYMVHRWGDDYDMCAGRVNCDDYDEHLFWQRIGGQMVLAVSQIEGRELNYITEDIVERDTRVSKTEYMSVINGLERLRDSVNKFLGMNMSISPSGYFTAKHYNTGIAAEVHTNGFTVLVMPGVGDISVLNLNNGGTVNRVEDRVLSMIREIVRNRSYSRVFDHEIRGYVYV
ncbi:MULTISPECIES: hypothetical protein [Bacillus amyloliquefaciens group]|uniref:hypothetical protein n=1 Tax=Bacillus amyloliquefaciens group TaxID=1938374 RepID=UPI00073B47E7|nr:MULTISPECIES: hypothetical protein [Bacillus amyloliquefaciens group]KTF59783.1 hypothetical protein AR691_13700 [Bacillus amyloliquefaciens]